MLQMDRLDAISRLRQAEARITGLERQVSQLSQMDPVTGLVNHQRFGDRLEQALHQSERHGYHLSVLFLDLDRFGLINEMLGHAGGDDLLRQVGQRLNEAIRQGDTLASMGGDRFMVLLPDITDAMHAVRVAQKLLDALKEPFHAGLRDILLTASIGVCIHPQDGNDVSTLEAHAESAMSRARERGGDRIECFTTTLNEVSLERHELESYLREAMANGEFQMYYQPQFHMDGRLAGAEALLRWNHPLLGTVPPIKFIPLAEENRLILPIGEWALQESCRQMAQWQALSQTPLQLAVNVSALQFSNGNWDECVVRALADSGLDPGCLELELTESLVMRQGQEDLRPLHRLREIGTKIALDDFGTGYSSLAYLQRLPITTLKVDQSFISTLQVESPEISSENIVKAVIQLAHSLNLTVVAEGVETEGQRDMLELLGCDLLQGYLLGRPIPADAFQAMLEFIANRDILMENSRPEEEATVILPSRPPRRRSGH